MLEGWYHDGNIVDCGASWYNKLMMVVRWWYDGGTTMVWYMLVVMVRGYNGDYDGHVTAQIDWWC